MKKFLKILALVYLFIITLVIFLPFSLIEKIINIFKIENKSSTFVDIENKEIISFFDIKFYSVKTFLLNIFLFPIFFLLNTQIKNIFKPQIKKRNETPKEVALIVNRQLTGNIKQIISKSKNNNVNYIFAIQPTLFYSGPQTDDDKKILRHRAKNPHKGFYFTDYFKEFYNTVKHSLSNDAEMKDHYFDFTNLFSKSSKQNFIDAVHLGDVAQDECAKKIAEIIKYKEKNMTK